MDQIPPEIVFLKKSYDHTVLAHAALDKAKARIDAYHNKQAAAEKLIPEVVEALVEHGRIDPSLREKAAELLRDHEQALRVLMNAADPTNGVSPKRVGEPTEVAEKSAGAFPIGNRRREMKKKADENYRRILRGGV